MTCYYLIWFQVVVPVTKGVKKQQKQPVAEVDSDEDDDDEDDDDEDLDSEDIDDSDGQSESIIIDLLLITERHVDVENTR